MRPRGTLFNYWGRRGLTQLTYEIGLVLERREKRDCHLVISRQNESFELFQTLNRPPFAISTFSSAASAVFGTWRIPRLRRELAGIIEHEKVGCVVDLMPHLWSPLVSSVYRQRGCRYVVIVHDAIPHTGDNLSRAALPILMQAVRQADKVITLSEKVMQQLVEMRLVAGKSAHVLFHPDLTFSQNARLRRNPRPPFRLAFFGRIQTYKGLPLFVEAIEILRARGICVEPGIFGDGNIDPLRGRLEALGAEIVNRWIPSDEIATLLTRYDAVVASHIEASQSGVVAAAHGLGLPVVATPVGGLREQVVDLENGTIASSATAEGIAEAAARLLVEPGVYGQIIDQIARGSTARSVERFVDELVHIAQQDK